MPKIIRKAVKKKFKPNWHKATVHSTEEFWNTRTIISSGREEFPLFNAYFIDEDGFRQYHLRFRKGITVHIDPQRTRQRLEPVNTRTGRQLLNRFYDLKLKPLAFKWIKARNPLETNRWVVMYPAHYAATVEMSETRHMMAKDHIGTLFYRSDHGLISIAQQEYEGHLKGNSQYEQPYILQQELREWRQLRMWFQDAITRDTAFEV